MKCGSVHLGVTLQTPLIAVTFLTINESVSTGKRLNSFDDVNACENEIT